MVSGRVRTIIARVALSVLCILGIAVAGSAVMQGSALAAAPQCAGYSGTQGGTPAFFVYTGQSGCVVAASHKCAQVGSATGTYTADECADVAVANTSTTQALWGTGEFYCQGGSGKCNAIENVVVYFSSRETTSVDAKTSESQPYSCSSGCPTDANRAMVSTPHLPGALNCFSAYSWDPAGETILNEGDGTDRSSSELDSNRSLWICLTPYTS